MAHGVVCVCRPAWQGSTSPRTTRRWARFKAARLLANPICQHVVDDGSACRRPGVECDHIVPLAEDMSLRYVWENTQILCAEHHRLKSAADSLRGKRRLR